MARYHHAAMSVGYHAAILGFEPGRRARFHLALYQPGASARLSLRGVNIFRSVHGFALGVAGFSGVGPDAAVSGNCR